jgi:hypothetical protein
LLERVRREALDALCKPVDAPLRKASTGDMPQKADSDTIKLVFATPAISPLKPRKSDKDALT